jgi:hypothetical protein
LVHVATHVLVDHKPAGQPHLLVVVLVEQHRISVRSFRSPALHVPGEPQLFDAHVLAHVLTLANADWQHVPLAVSKLAEGQHASVTESTRWLAPALGQQ